ncbi:TPA: hypothetical protein IUT93_001107 [Enterococcus faecalis]|nr:hypothetical protein [Enterococcus faecalis]
MENYYTEKEFENLVTTIADAIKDFNLVVFIGAGISLSQGYPNWDGYIEKLIHFWQFNIRNFPEAEGKISNKLLSQFDEILKSNNTNKRKIDLLHTLLYGILGEKFDDVKLSFEEYFFNEVAPDSIENMIIAELIKLDPIFITSNYDFEIERHLKRSKQKGTYKPINNIHEFVNSENMLRSGDVLHLHGTTEGDWSFFVNSSFDYSRQYLKEPQDFMGLNKWFQEKKPVVIFLGSSMEEEEILSLLPATTKNYALMKANSNETLGFREIYNQTYQKNNATTIFWYGDSYDDLPKKVNEIVSAVQEELEIPESIDDWNTLHTLSIEDGVFKEILEKHSDDERFLFDIFKADDFELEKKILKNALNSHILVGKLNNISSFWTMINKKFETLDRKQIHSIIKIFQNKKLSVYWDEVFEVFGKLRKSSEVNQEDIDKIRKNLSQHQEIIRTSFASDPDLMGYWLVEQLQQGHSYFRNIFYKEEALTINLKSEMISQIVAPVTDEFRYHFSSFKEIISDDLIKIIYKSFFKKMFFWDNSPILDSYPDSLLEPRLFQRILVNIDNESNLSDSVANRLIDHIDFSDSIFGKELNIFVNNHRKQIEKSGKNALENYHDGIGEVEGGVVHQKSFIDNNQVISEDVDTIIRILLPEIDENSLSVREDFLTERTYQATSDFLISSLSKNDEVSEKVKKIILKKGTLLYDKYQKLFIEILTSDVYDPNLKMEALKIFLNKFSLHSFSWEEKRLFEHLIDKEEFENSAFDKLLQVNVNNLRFDYMYTDKARPELLELDDFINTELGKYLDILIKLSKRDHSRHSMINSIVSNVNSKEFREFTQGALSSVNSSIDLEEITINTFQGYSYSIQGFQKSDLEKFESVGRFILKMGYVNDFNKSNLFILSLQKIDPKMDITEINWSEINFSLLIDIVLDNKFEFEYETQWIEEIILNDTDGQYGMNILYSLADKQAILFKSEKVFELFKKCIDSYKGKINIGLLPHSIEKLQDNQKKDLLIRHFFLLLDNAKISVDYFGSRNLVDLMKQFDSDSQKKLAKHPNLSTILSPLEIEDLKREIK